MSWSDDLLQSLIPESRKQEIKDYDDLTDIEKETYQKMLDMVQSSTLSLDDLKNYIKSMRQSVEYELAKMSQKDEEKNIFLKARLLNYIMFESFFDRPDRAKETLKFLMRRGKV